MHTLKRTDFKADGIFGNFTFDGELDPFMVTLEHAYDDGNGGYVPKVRPGTYRCVRGIHQLSNGKPFETFEITGVDGHSGILFHAGSFNRDSHGCVLCGTARSMVKPGEEIITGSRIRFSEWLERMEGINEFDLEVV